jgi:hypothetical protein
MSDSQILLPRLHLQRWNYPSDPLTKEHFSVPKQTLKPESTNTIVHYTTRSLKKL